MRFFIDNICRTSFVNRNLCVYRFDTWLVERNHNVGKKYTFNGIIVLFTYGIDTFCDIICNEHTLE